MYIYSTFICICMEPEIYPLNINTKSIAMVIKYFNRNFTKIY